MQKLKPMRKVEVQAKETVTLKLLEGYILSKDRWAMLGGKKATQKDKGKFIFEGSFASIMYAVASMHKANLITTETWDKALSDLAEQSPEKENLKENLQL